MNHPSIQSFMVCARILLLFFFIFEAISFIFNSLCWLQFGLSFLVDIGVRTCANPSGVVPYSTLAQASQILFFFFKNSWNSWWSWPFLGDFLGKDSTWTSEALVQIWWRLDIIWLSFLFFFGFSCAQPGTCRSIFLNRYTRFLPKWVF